MDQSQAVREMQESENVNEELRIKGDEKVKELSSLMMMHEQHRSEQESQLSDLKFELHTLHSKNKELESQVQSQANEAQQLRDENLKLHSRVLELEIMSERRQDGDSVSNSTSETADRIADQSSDLQEELVLRVQNSYMERRMECMRSEASAQVRDLTDQVYVMQQELQSLRAQNDESQHQLECRTKEVSENLIQIETLKVELQSLRAQNAESQQQIESKDKEVSESLIQIETLKEELQSLRAQNAESQHQLENKTKEASQNLVHLVSLNEELARTLEEMTMIEEKEDLAVKINNELEQQIKSKEHETTQLRDEKEELQARIFELEGLITARDKDLVALQKKLGSGEKLESSGSLFSHNLSKFNKIVKESEESTKKATKEFNFKGGPQAVQRKMEELAANFRKTMEDKIRLLSRRIRVLEQLHAENTAHYRLMHETLEQENKELKAKVTLYEAELKKVNELHSTAKTTMKGLDFMVGKLEAGNTNLNRASKMLDELQMAKNWIQVKGEEIRKLGYSLDTLNTELRDMEEQKALLRENIAKLEAKVSSEGEEKLKLMKSIGQLELMIEEKDEELEYLGEEKREAIRQLCLLIDHHQTEKQQLKDVITELKGSRRSQGRH